MPRKHKKLVIKGRAVGAQKGRLKGRTKLHPNFKASGQKRGRKR